MRHPPLHFPLALLLPASAAHARTSGKGKNSYWRELGTRMACAVHDSGRIEDRVDL